MGIMVVIKSGPGEASRVEEALRLSAAMLGYDKTPAIVFVDEGVECLRKGALGDPDLADYLRAASDLAGVYAHSESLERRGLRVEEIDEDLDVTLLGMGGFAEMLSECGTAAVF